jgi:hypothetical protein
MDDPKAWNSLPAFVDHKLIRARTYSATGPSLLLYFGEATEMGNAVMCENSALTII